MKKIIALVALSTAVAACSNTPQKQNVTIIHKVSNDSGVGNVTTKGAVIESSNPELRAAMQNGAIEGPNGIYFMPIGKDRDGCPYYTSFAPGKVTLTAVYYRKADGSFTNSRSEADCAVGR